MKQVLSVSIFTLLCGALHAQTPLEVVEKPSTGTGLDVTLVGAGELRFLESPSREVLLNAHDYLTSRPQKTAGVLSWSRLKPGAYNLRFEGDRSVLILAVQLKQNTLTQLSVTLPGPLVVTGRIVDSREKPVPGAWVSSLNYAVPAGDQHSMFYKSWARTDRGGAYSLPIVPLEQTFTSAYLLVDDSDPRELRYGDRGALRDVVSVSGRRYFVSSAIWDHDSKAEEKLPREGERKAADFVLHELAGKAVVELKGFRNAKVHAYVRGQWLGPSLPMTNSAAGSEKWKKIGEGTQEFSSLPLHREVLFAAKDEDGSAPVFTAVRVESEGVTVSLAAPSGGTTVEARFRGVDTDWRIQEIRPVMALLVLPKAYRGLDDPSLAVWASANGLCRVHGVTSGDVVVRPLSWIETRFPNGEVREDLWQIWKILTAKLQKQKLAPRSIDLALSDDQKKTLDFEIN